MKYVEDNLELQSAVGRRRLTSLSWSSDMKVIKKAHDIVEAFVELMPNERLDSVKQKLTHVRDIHTTISNLKKGVTLNDVELFEIKFFCIAIEDIRNLLDGLIHLLILPSQKKVIKILDPQNSKTPTFYLYDEYSAELKTLRNRLRICSNDHEKAVLIEKLEEVENDVRRELTKELRANVTNIDIAYNVVGDIDLGMAKADMALKWGLCRPAIGGNELKFKQLFNPQVKTVLENKGKKYQPVDVRLENGATILTGANMTGKTVLMKTIALAQRMCQMGFFVPAEEAAMPIFDDIELCVDDGQSELTGLSSYAAEILNIDRVVKRVKQGDYLLVLIDELARTTNPIEGKKIVEAVAAILNRKKTVAMISTHYDSVETSGRQLMVKGLKANEINRFTTVDNINDYIDYSLVDKNECVVTNQALLIAEIMGVDEEIIKLANNKYE